MSPPGPTFSDPSAEYVVRSTDITADTAYSTLTFTVFYVIGLYDERVVYAGLDRFMADAYCSDANKGRI